MKTRPARGHPHDARAVPARPRDKKQPSGVTVTAMSFDRRSTAGNHRIVVDYTLPYFRNLVNPHAWTQRAMKLRGATKCSSAPLIDLPAVDCQGVACWCTCMAGCRLAP